MGCQTFLNYLKMMEPGLTPEEYKKKISFIIDEIKNEEYFNRNLIIIKALSNKLRYLILRIIKKQPMCTCSLANTLDQKEGAISHHLKILQNAELIFGRNKGYYTIYYYNDEIDKLYENHQLLIPI